MALKISWSEKAGKSFEEIIEYLELEFGYQVAKSIAKDIYHTLEILSVFPEPGSIENKNMSSENYIIRNQQAVHFLTIVVL